MAKLYSHTIRVSGTGEFPVDMLRYDCCWPANQEASGEMVLSRWPREREGAPRPRTVEIATVRRTTANPFTISRWHSFLWTVDVNSHSYRESGL